MLLPRLLTIFVGLPLLILLIHLGGMTFSLFTVFVSMICLYEYDILLRLARRPIQKWTPMILGSFISLNLVLGGSTSFAIFFSLLIIFITEMWSSSARYSLDRAALTLFGTLWLGLLPGYMALLRDLRPAGERLAFLLFVSTWLMDSSAYAVGRLFGRRKLSALSPKKTWEGAVAGFVAALGTVLLFHHFYPDDLSPRRAMIIGIVIALAGQLSDLAESMIKRALGAKDSGALLPGHGGVLDRFDSFLLSAPAVYYCLIFK